MELTLMMPNDWREQKVEVEIGDTLYHKNAAMYHPFEILEISKNNLKLRYLGYNWDGRPLVVEKSPKELYTHGWHKEETILEVEPVGDVLLSKENDCRKGQIGICQFVVMANEGLYIDFYVGEEVKVFRIKNLTKEELVKISDRKIIDTCLKAVTFDVAGLERIITSHELAAKNSLKKKLNEYVRNL